MIEVRGLTKRYGNLEAVKGLSFSVGKDQVLGFLGPNGAGKTTMMKILTAYHFPSEGEAWVDGLSIEEDPVGVKRRVGYLPENVPLYGDLTVEEYLSFVAEARGIPRRERRDARERSLEACDLRALRSRRIETLSKGFRQRVGLAQAILPDPPILILDEPTSGLDPNQIIEIRSLIRELGKRKTVILSTHILQEAEAVCSRVLILNQGRLAAQGRPEDIAAALRGGDTWDLILKSSGPDAIRADVLRRKITALGGRLDGRGPEAGENGGPGGEALGVRLGEDGTAAVSFFVPLTTASPAPAGERIFDWAVAEGLKILAMSRKTLSLEDLFVKLTVGEPLTASEQLTTDEQFAEGRPFDKRSPAEGEGGGR